jgi:hypothetical protein
MAMSLLGWRRPRAAGLPAARASTNLAAHSERLFWWWAAMVTLVIFLAWWLRERGVWRAMVDGDPSGISLGICVLSVAVTLWCGRRAWRLAQGALPHSAWRQHYAKAHGGTSEAAMQALAEHTHGPHETAWWFCAACIKLGLLGTVVGFIVMASQIGSMPNFDFDQVQGLLKRMTDGMAIALYTTLVGLVGNLWLGLQLMLLDRQADKVAADILANPLDVDAAGDGRQP